MITKEAKIRLLLKICEVWFLLIKTISYLINRFLKWVCILTQSFYTLKKRICEEAVKVGFALCG